MSPVPARAICTPVLWAISIISLWRLDLMPTAIGATGRSAVSHDADMPRQTPSDRNRGLPRRNPAEFKRRGDTRRMRTPKYRMQEPLSAPTARFQEAPSASSADTTCTRVCGLLFSRPHSLRSCSTDPCKLSAIGPVECLHTKKVEQDCSALPCFHRMARPTSGRLDMLCSQKKL